MLSFPASTVVRFLASIRLRQLTSMHTEVVHTTREVGEIPWHSILAVPPPLANSNSSLHILSPGQYLRCDFLQAVLQGYACLGRKLLVQEDTLLTYGKERQHMSRLYHVLLVVRATLIRATDIDRVPAVVRMTCHLARGGMLQAVEPMLLCSELPSRICLKLSYIMVSRRLSNCLQGAIIPGECQGSSHTDLRSPVQSTCSCRTAGTHTGQRSVELLMTGAGCMSPDRLIKHPLLSNGCRHVVVMVL